MHKESIKIGIIEPSVIIYEGLSKILKNFDENISFHSIINMDELEEELNFKKNIDIIIINPATIQNKIKKFKRIKKTYPGIYWIGFIYSLFDVEILSLLDDTISINDSTETICKNMEKIIEGNFDKNDTKQQEQLSDREKDVLIQLVNGLSNKEIADKLNISTHTVISHRKNITIKTGIKSQSGLTIYAITKNIISLDKLG